jgi:hypothetical protein
MHHQHNGEHGEFAPQKSIRIFPDFSVKILSESVPPDVEELGRECFGMAGTEGMLLPGFQPWQGWARSRPDLGRH